MIGAFVLCMNCKPVGEYIRFNRLISGSIARRRRRQKQVE
jgi:hypothetical protein